MMSSASIESHDVLDQLRDRDYISEVMHQAGMRFKWLQMLQFGIHSLRSYFPDFMRRARRYFQDERWLSSRKQEYFEACSLLQEKQLYDATYNLCITGQQPPCIWQTLEARYHNRFVDTEFQTMKDGLELLVNYFDL